MNTREKRYGLRRKATKKKLDDDFEYYFVKIRKALATPAPRSIKEERQAKLRETLDSVSDLVKTPPKEQKKGKNVKSPSASSGKKEEKGAKVAVVRAERVSLKRGTHHILITEPKDASKNSSPSKHIKRKVAKTRTVSENDETLSESETEKSQPPTKQLKRASEEDGDGDEEQLKPKDTKKVTKNSGKEPLPKPKENLKSVAKVEVVKEEPEPKQTEESEEEEEELEDQREETEEPREEEVIAEEVVCTELEDERISLSEEMDEEDIEIQEETEKENVPAMEGINHEIEELQREEEESALQLVLQTEDDDDDYPSNYHHVMRGRGRRRGRGRGRRETIIFTTCDEEKIECEECHKMLKPSSYRQHLRTHTGIRPFSCEMCDARFTRKGDVLRHVKIVHQKEKPYKCCRCQRAFGDKKNLRWHLMNHDKKLFYICEVCGFKFGKQEYWENHVRFIHPIQSDGQSTGPFEHTETIVITPGGGGESQIAATQLEQEAQNIMYTTEEGGDVDDPTEEDSHNGHAQNEDGQEEYVAMVQEPDIHVQEGGEECVVTTDSHGTQLARLVNLSSEEAQKLGTVVIQFNDDQNVEQSMQPQAHFRADATSNVVHMITSNVTKIVQGSDHESQHIIIQTPSIADAAAIVGHGNAGNARTKPNIIKVAMDNSQADSQLNSVGQMEVPSKVINIVVKEQENETEELQQPSGQSSVQTLVEALLDAAKKFEDAQDTPKELSTHQSTEVPQGL